MAEYVYRLHPFAFCCLVLAAAGGCTKAPAGWPVYKADSGSSSYSSLDQIDLTNVHELTVAWRLFPDDSADARRTGKYECNPIVVDSVLYATSPRLLLFAAHAGTGKKLWSFNPVEAGVKSINVNRGVTFWKEGDDQRVLFTAGNFLFAVDARTGKLIRTFGDGGKVNLNEGLGVPPDSVWVAPTSPGIVYQNLLIIGGEVSELRGAAPGHIRAYDIRDGSLVWTFHTIPQPGETGYDTWPADAWKSAGGANNWGGMSLDEKRGLVFVPTGSPTYDFYGGDRKGMNLFGNCLLALEASTGKLRWYFQTVHHDLWDYDLPAPPNLVSLTVDGKKRDAVAQTSKTGFLYILDRDTGEPIFPIEERPVPASLIPGEQAWPTQPFPLKPAPYVRHMLTEADLNSQTPEGLDSLKQLIASLRYEGLFTPPDPRGTLMLPGTRGGSEWGGAAFDATSGTLYLNANESPEIATVKRVNLRQRSEGLNLYRSGRELYMTLCASCHGTDRLGQAPDYPNLRQLKERMTPETAWQKIKTGAGRMPAFGNILENQRDAIIAYLYDIREAPAKMTTADPADTVTSYLNVTAYGHLQASSRYPAIKPPWGTLSALDLNTGEYRWQVPLGVTVDEHGDTLATGTENWGGPAVTGGGLLFIASTQDKMFRAFNKHTGELAWQTSLQGYGFATPAVYAYKGKQYVVVAVTGDKENPGGSLVAYALPR